MEARILKAIVLLAAIGSLGASHRTANFVVQAPTPDLARQIGETAEKYRRELAIEWTGSAMPNWAQPCPIVAQVGEHLGAGGATSFVFDRGEVFSWDMNIQGSHERLLDSVLPHEVMHTVFATHFRQPLPRWADEGACTTVEHPAEKSKQEKMLIYFLQNKQGIAFSKMFAMREYPKHVMPLYSQGFSLARYLLAQGGKRKYVAYVGEGLETGDWVATTKRHYGYENLADLQESWLTWVKQGSPNTVTGRNAPTQVASTATTGDVRSNGDALIRFQSPDAGPKNLVPVKVKETSTASPAADARSDWQAGALAQTPGLLSATPNTGPTGGTSIYAQGARGASLVTKPAPESAGGAPVREASRQPLLEWHR